MSGLWRAFVFVFCIFGLPSKATAQVEWSTVLNTPTSYIAFERVSVLSNADGTSFVAASQWFERRIRVTKLGIDGAVLWDRWLYGTVETRRVPIFAAENGSAVVAYADSQQQPCVARFLTNGDKQFESCNSAPYFSGGVIAATAMPNGDIIVGTQRRRLTAFQADGAVRWRSAYDRPYDENLRAFGAADNGNYFELWQGTLLLWSGASGELVASVPPPPQGDYCCLPAPVLDETRAVATGSSIVAAYAYTSGSLRLTKVSNQGSVEWSRNWTLGTIGDAGVATVFPDGAGGVYVVARPAFTSEATLARVSADGTMLWHRDNVVAWAAFRAGNDFAVLSAAGDTNTFTIYRNVVDPSSGSFVSRVSHVLPASPVPTLQQASATEIVINAAKLTALSYNLVQRWQYAYVGTVPATSDEGGCSVPPLQRGKVTNYWWARVSAQWGNSWVRVENITGDILARSARADSQCGFPMYDDDNRVLVGRDYPQLGALKVRPDLSVVWQTSTTVGAGSGDVSIRLHTATNGDRVFFEPGRTHGRVSDSGQVLYQLPLESEVGAIYARFQTVEFDSAGNALLFYPSWASLPRMTRVSPTGVVLDQRDLYPTCPATRPIVLQDGGVAFAGLCGAVSSEATLYRLNPNGTTAWQSTLVRPPQHSPVTVRQVITDQFGNIYAAGCANAPYFGAADYGTNVVASWNSSGALRWSYVERATASTLWMIPCVTSIVSDGTGGVYGAVSGNDSYLFRLDDSGRQLWRHTSALSERPAAAAHLSPADPGKIMVTVTEGASDLHPSRVVLRKLDLAGLPSAKVLRFSSIPGTATPVRTPFSVSVELRNAEGTIVLAESPTTVRLAVFRGTGQMLGGTNCLVQTGQSSCSIPDVQYSAVDSGVTFVAWFDGGLPELSSELVFRQAPTATSIAIQGTAPFVAYSKRRVAVTVAGMPADTGFLEGRIDTNVFEPARGITNCQDDSWLTRTRSFSCDFFVRSAAMPLTASFSGSPFYVYEDSAAAPFSVAVQRVVPTFAVAPLAGSQFVAGQPVELVVRLLGMDGRNVSGYLPGAPLTANGTSCGAVQQAGTYESNFAGSQFICRLTPTASGQFVVVFAFAGADDLLPATSSNFTYPISPRGQIAGVGSFVAGTKVCATNETVRCSVETATGTWSCVGPEGASSLVFFQPPSPGSGSYASTPVQIAALPTNGVAAGSVSYVPTPSACGLDFDGDGATLPGTDGLLLLRRMLGLSASALSVGATHTCVPTNGLDHAATTALAGYDIDGDSQVRADTDGLIILRALLGFTGNRLVDGVVGANATRRTAAEITTHLVNACGLRSASP